MLKRDYLVTGITGFVGPNLANHLISEGHQVYGLVRREGSEKEIRDAVPKENYDKMKFIYEDFTDRDAMDDLFKTASFDGVFHIGAFTHPPTSFLKPEESYNVNFLGTRNIVDAIKNNQRDCAMMYCSSAEVYGVVPKEEQPITENTLLRPANPYGMGKALGDVYTLGHSSVKAKPFDLKTFVTRAFSHTGIRRAQNFSVSSDAYQLIKIKKGLQEPIIKVGTLSSQRPVMDVRDCVRGYSMLMDMAIEGDDRVIGNVFNMSGDKLFSMRELLDQMKRLTGLENIVEEIDPKLVRPIDIPLQRCDDTKMRKLTGWKQEKDVLTETLPSLLNYWENKL